MQEAELFELVFISGATAMTAFNFVVTFTFAYLTVAYFLGAKLSRLERSVVTGVYLIASFLSFSVIMANVSAMRVFQEELADSRAYQRISIFMDARIYEAGMPVIYATFSRDLSVLYVEDSSREARMNRPALSAPP